MIKRHSIIICQRRVVSRKEVEEKEEEVAFLSFENVYDVHCYDV